MIANTWRHKTHTTTLDIILGSIREHSVIIKSPSFISFELLIPLSLIKEIFHIKIENYAMRARKLPEPLLPTSLLVVTVVTILFRKSGTNSST